MASISLTKVIDKMKMENLTPDVDIKPIKVMQPDINRPALQLAGYVEHYESTRLQILGFVEYTYMQSLTEERKKEVYAEVIREGCHCTHATPTRKCVTLQSSTRLHFRSSETTGSSLSTSETVNSTTQRTTSPGS